jgi:hypothetical protein
MNQRYELQLHLFRSNRQRGKRAPPPLEFALHCQVADTLRRWTSHGWIFTHLPMGEHRDAVTGSRLKRMGVSPGWPDFIFIPPVFPANARSREDPGVPPRPHFLELKRAGRGRLSEAQADFAAWCVANGCPHAVAHSYDEAVKILQAWGVLRSGLKVQ